MNNCFVEKQCLLGQEGQGMAIFNYTMSMERPLLLAFQVGIMEAQLARNVDFCKQRKQGGRSIIENQSISNRIADMTVRFETSKLLLKEVAEQLKNKKNTYYMSSVAKLFISESLVANSLDSMRNMGTLGYMTEYQNEQQLRDSLGSLFYSGTSDIQRNIISSMV
jgi:alkylation response protein AidB-like acyl-CoA dehydrogenase